MKKLTKRLKGDIQKNSLIADAMGAIISKKERQSLKNHLISTTVKKGGGKLLTDHSNRSK
jgi:hypothetical protein